MNGNKYDFYVLTILNYYCVGKYTVDVSEC